jgi:hypothetical protein
MPGRKILTGKTIIRLGVLGLCLAGAWVLAWHRGRVREDTVRCTDVHSGGSLTVVWRGHKERIELPGPALELRDTPELHQRAAEAGVSPRQMVHRAWLDREELARRVRGKRVRLAWPRGRGARDEQGRLIAKVLTRQGALTASGAHAMGGDTTGN